MRLANFDLLSALPEELSIQVLSFLPVDALCKCQLVCKRWRSLATDSQIWKRKYLEFVSETSSESPLQPQEHPLTQQSYPYTSSFPYASSLAYPLTPFLNLSSALPSHRCSSLSPSSCAHLMTSQQPLRSSPTTRLSSPPPWRSFYRSLYIREQNWSAGSVQSIRYFRGHSSQIFFVTIKDGMAVSLAVDRSLRYWDVEKGICLSHVQLSHTAEEVAFLPREWVVAVAFRTEFIHIYNLQTHSPPLTLTSPSRSSLPCVNIDGKYVVAGSDDGIVNVWNWKDGSVVACYNTGKEILYVQIRNNKILSLHSDGTYTIYSLSIPSSPLRSISYLSLQPTDAVVSATSNSRFLLCATSDLIYLFSWPVDETTREPDFTKPPVKKWEMDAPGIVPWCGCLAGRGRCVISNCSSAGPICVVKPEGMVRFLTGPEQKEGGRQENKRVCIGEDANEEESGMEVNPGPWTLSTTNEVRSTADSPILSTNLFSNRENVSETQPVSTNYQDTASGVSLPSISVDLDQRNIDNAVDNPASTQTNPSHFANGTSYGPPGWKLLNLEEQPTFMDVDDRYLVIGTRQGSLIRCGFD